MGRITSMTIFTTVVASGSFAAAAERLNMSPASIIVHVQGLEHRLGARLLNRTTRKLSLTEPSRAYFDKAVRIRAEIEGAERSITEPQSTPRGTLRINAASASPKCRRRYSTRSV
jgi:DNA-binding transcriptional LysR family regulator